MKKAQIQISETIIVIFIVIILLVMGMVFFQRYQERSILGEQEKYELQKFDNQLLIIPTLPEIQCSRLLESKNCIDTTKLQVFKEISNSDHYRKKLGFKTIQVKTIYPQQNIIGCPNENCNSWIIYSNPKDSGISLIRTSPVSLYNPITNTYSIGELSIEAN